MSLKDDSIVVSSSGEQAGVENGSSDWEKEDVAGSVPLKYRGTQADKRDMAILGKDQVLRVRWTRIPTECMTRY